MTPGSRYARASSWKKTGWGRCDTAWNVAPPSRDTYNQFEASTAPGGPPGAVLASNWLYVSHDGGATFNAVSHLPQPVFFQEEALAYLEPGVIFVGGQGTSGRNLLGSFDGGRHWQRVYTGQAFSLNFT